MTFMQYSIQHKNYTPMFDMVPHCQVPWCPRLLYGAVLYGSALSTLAIWCRIVSSRVVHHCYMVPRCPLSLCQPSQFRWSRDVQFRVFSRPLKLCIRWAGGA